MLLSTEIEHPVVSIWDGRPPPPEVFASLWQELAAGSWQHKDFGVERDYPNPAVCINPAQAVTTDSGPTVELVPSPAPSLSAIARQLRGIRLEVRSRLQERGYAMLGCGVHPRLEPTPDDYYRYRTQRAGYDYAISERGWRHWSIVHIASAQEVIDVSIEDAPRAIRLLNRLTGLMNFVLRNDPDFFSGDALSVRPRAWMSHVPTSGPFADDRHKMGLPEREIQDWHDYLALLWESGPMFLLGTKNSGLAWVPQNPTFMEFLQDVPDGGWPARTLTGERLRVTPELAHVQQSDWSHMGFARIRWKWHENSSGIEELLEAWQRRDIEAFLAANLVKVVVENRGNSTQPPDEDLVSVALVCGLLANLDEALEFALEEPYPFWQEVLDASLTEPLGTSVRGRSIPDCASDMVELAGRGLEARGEDHGLDMLAIVQRRIDERCSPSERLLRAYREGGIERVLELTRVR